MTEPVLTVRGLVRRFGEVVALHGVDLEVHAGTIHGLVGPDGAGKTTTMRIAAGVMGPTEGTVRVLSRDPLSGAAEVRRTIGYMPQQYSLYGDLSVEENLHFFARMFGLDKKAYQERRARLLAITRLERFTERRADALSGGMYKKLALACSLLPRPQVLILDEPTNGVDPVSRRELWALLFELAAEGMAVLVSTAYMDEAARCHQVAMIHDGRIIAAGEPGRLVADFPHPTFSVSGGDRAAVEGELEAHGAVLARSFAGVRFRVVVEAGRQAELEAVITRLGGKMQREQPDFEDLFLAEIAIRARARARAA